MYSPTRKKIGIIGGGASGLVSAWLLEENYDVTLFEKEADAGGHVATYVVKQDHKSVSVDLFFHVFTNHYLLFCSLLRILDVKKQKINFTVRYNDTVNNKIYILPPSLPFILRNGRSLKNLMLFSLFMQIANQLESDEISIGEVADSNPIFDENFKSYFLYPLISAPWVVSHEMIKSMSAKLIAKFISISGIDTPLINNFYCIQDGCTNYIKKLQTQLHHTQILLNTPVERIEKNGAQWVVHCKNQIYTFDKLIMACHANTAKNLLAPVDKNIAELLDNFRYDSNMVYLHSDTNLLPKQRKDWEKYNDSLNPERDYTTGTCWVGMEKNINAFVTIRLKQHEIIQKDKIIYSCPVEHPILDKRAILARKNLESCQGQQQIWFAGTYVTGFGFHESAIQSAVNIASLLCPESKRLTLLKQNIKTIWLDKLWKNPINFVVAQFIRYIVAPILRIKR